MVDLATHVCAGANGEGLGGNCFCHVIMHQTSPQIHIQPYGQRPQRKQETRTRLDPTVDSTSVAACLHTNTNVCIVYQLRIHALVYLPWPIDRYHWGFTFRIQYHSDERYLN